MPVLPPDRTYRFCCPECGEEITVDPGMRALLLADGCVVCDAPIDVEHFEVHD